MLVLENSSSDFKKLKPVRKPNSNVLRSQLDMVTRVITSLEVKIAFLEMVNLNAVLGH